MTEETTNTQDDTPPSDTEAKKDQGETKQVDTKVQEEAAKERSVSGGYD